MSNKDSLIGVLLKRRLTVVFCVVGWTACFSAFWLIAPRNFEAKGLLLVEGDSRLQASNRLPSNPVAESNFLNSQVHVLRSYEVVRAALAKVDKPNVSSAQGPTLTWVES